MKFLDRIWKVINSPVIVVLLALSVWPILSAFTIQQAISKITTDTVETISEAFQDMGNDDEEAREFLEYKDRIVFTNIKHAHSGWSNKEKIVATVTNNYDKPVKRVVANISFYNQDNELIDVIDNQWISIAPILQPNESFNFSVSRETGDLSTDAGAQVTGKSDKVVMKISSVELFTED